MKVNNQQKVHGSAWQAVSLTWELMTPSEKRKGIYLAIGSVFVSLIDVIALVGVVPLVSLIVDHTTIHTNKAINQFFLFIGKPEYETFVEILAVVAILLIALSVVLNILKIWITKRYRVACQNRLAKDLISRCVGAPYAWTLKQNSSTLTHYVYNDVLIWSSGGIHGIVAIIGHLTLLILSAILVINAANIFGLLGIFIIGLISASIMIVLRPKIKNLSIFQRSASAKGFTVAREFLSGIKDVKLSGHELSFINHYLHTFNTYGETMGKLKVLQAIPPLMMLLIGQTSIIVIALILWSSGLQSGEIASEMALVLLVIARVVPVITRLSSEFATLWNTIPNLKGIHKILNEVHRSSSNFNLTKNDILFSTWKTIKVDSVSYQYGAKEPIVISKTTALIEKGNSYGIVGPTGSGKTTLVDLILGLLWPSEGDILIDNIPLQKEEVREWQKNIGYVPQNPTIIDDTLLANVCFGITLDEIDREYAKQCLINADLSDVLDEVTLDGSLGEGGDWLSGGQRQRVCIARALYNRPKILILDEATSALDTLSENAIRHTLKNLDGEVTIIMIAHRLTTIQHCDEIFVLDNGRITDRGKYDFLINNSPLFKKLVSSKDL